MPGGGNGLCVADRGFVYRGKHVQTEEGIHNAKSRSGGNMAQSHDIDNVLLMATSLSLGETRHGI